MRQLFRISLKFPRLLRFLLFYLHEIVRANLRVAHDVLTPRLYMRPGIIAVELQAETDLEIAVLANLITMTPGTLTLDVSSDRRVIYIHALYVGEAASFRRSVQRLEAKTLELLR